MNHSFASEFSRHSVRRSLSLAVALTISLLSGLWNAPIEAQSDLTAYTPVEGSIDTAGGSQSWTFSGVEGEVISLLAQSGTAGEASSGLDPTLTLTGSSGALISEDDDIAYPGATDALIQAVTLPRTDTYTVTVTGYQTSTGGYTLTFLHGYPQMGVSTSFDADSEWSTSLPDLALDQVAGQIALSLSGIRLSGYAVRVTDEALTDFYADAVITSAEGRNGWTGGLVLRQQQDSYYAVMINENRQWRFVLVTPSGEQVLRDWTTHPAIPAGATSFRLGVLANGSSFDLFYNALYIGQVLDPANTLPEGRVGLYVATANAAGSSSLFTFDDLVITVPYHLGTEEVLPDQLAAGAQALTIQELERRRVIPPGGEIGLTVPESFGQRVNPGVNRIVLGRGSQFEAMVLNTTLSWTAAAPGVVGCGLVFDSQSDTQYTLAYLDQTGGYGVSTRSGDRFSPGIFGVNPDWTAGSQNLLVVRLADRIHYYVNRHYVGTLPLTDESKTGGEIGVAVVNYETIDTSCQFNDTWIWRLTTP